MSIFSKIVDALNAPLPGTKAKKPSGKTVGPTLPGLGKKTASAKASSPSAQEKAAQTPAKDIQAAIHKRDAELARAAAKAKEDAKRNNLMAERKRLQDMRREYEQELTKQAQAHTQSPKTTYTVARGDTLWGISQRFLGKGNRWKEIHEANKGQIANPNLIYPGQVIVIPDND